MARWRGTGRAQVRRLRVMIAAGALLAGVAAVPPQAAATSHPGAPPLPKVAPASGVGKLGVRKARTARAVPRYRARETSWPAAAQASLALDTTAAPLTPAGQAAAQRTLVPQGAVARATGIPVWAQSLPGHPAVTGMRVRVASHAVALAAGVHGVVFTARPAAGSQAGPVRLGLDYARFSQASGGNYGLGLGLVELPACALTTPRQPACRVERPLPSLNDPVLQNVSAQVSLPAGATVGTAAAGMVLAATTASSDGGGPAGTYSATSLRPSGTWSAGGSSGAFTYSYPLTVPPAASGLMPSLALNYDSGRVDGQTAASQVQAPWAGDGWSTPESFIEQSFTPCADSPEGSAAPQSTQDACYGGPVITWSQDGSSNPLVCPVPFSYTTTSTCKASGDSGEVITHHVNSGNGSGTRFTDYWTLTERDGTTYYFGRNQLPGWASGDPATGSVDYEPVYSAHSGDPCYSSAGFSSSACTMAYRWNLDYVTDLHGNAMAYYYGRDWNAYAQDGNTSSAVSYTRDSHLDHIDYGFTGGNAYAGHAPDEVVFKTGDRCFAANCDPISSYPANWPDVPYTQDYCAAGGSCQVTGPTFWSTVRLASITTQQWNGTAYAPADSWSLAQSLPQPADQTSPTLWLDSITHTGSDTTAGGSTVKLPQVTFSPVDQPNRVNPGNYPGLDRFRIQQITTETGAQISVSYELTNPCSPSSLPSPSADTSSCFPVYWQQFTPSTGADWFNKYAVASVAVSDPTGGSPGVYTSYAYNSPAWHYDDNELVQPKYRTYGQWRGYQTVYTYTGTGTDAQTKTKTDYYQGMDGDTLPSGTRSVTLTDSQGGQHADINQLAGNILESTSYDYKSGPVDHSSIYSYWVSAAAATRTRSGVPDLTANATGLVETWTRQALTDGGTTTWRKTETDTSYDATPSDALFGLPRYQFSHGDLADSTQQTCTTTTYAPANTSENLVGLVAETETDAQPCGGANPGGASAPGSGQVNALTAPSSLSRPADVISDTRTFYDNPTLATTWPQPVSPAWPQPAPSLGDASVVQQATGYTSGAFTYQTKSAAVYDSSGRPVSSYDGNGNLTTTSYTMANGVTTGDKVTNPLSQATSTTFDPLRGIPVSVTDPNSITTTVHYDGLGRLIDVWGYNRATTSAASEIYSYAVSNSAPTVVTTQQLNDESGYITSTTLYDALLRARQTQTPAPNGGMLVTDHFYDSRGWEGKTNTSWLDPGANPGPAIVTVPDSQVPDQQVTAFDGLGRPVLVTSYDDSAVKSTTASAYYGDKVTTVPPTGATPTSTASDALGRTTELDSYTSVPAVTTSVSGGITSVAITGGTTQATGYTYNHRGELSDIKDTATGEDWGKTYNLLGQVTGTTHPDAGATTMTYDPNGNLASSTDARGKTISYTYDALNRKTGEYDGPSSTSPQLASWVYDNSNGVSGVTDPAGQLTTETSYSGGNAYTLQQKGFNVFGESLGQTLTLPAAEGGLAGSYTLTHLYSSTTGLLLRDTYPASPGGGALPAETVTHNYGSGFDLPKNLQSTLAAYSQNTTYTAFSQVAQEEIGNLASNAYITDTYDPHTGALTDSNVKNTAVSATPFDDTSYAYDPSGNITSQADTRNGTATETQCFAYDTLDRLTQAWTATDNCAANPSGNNGSTVGDSITGGTYWTSWAFNPLGNRTTQTQHSTTGGTSTVTSYTYGTSQPDTLTSTSTTGPSGSSSSSYTYNPAGDTLTRNLPSGNQALTWTDDGKLATDTTSAGTTSYVYDAGGNVLLQKDPGKTTLFAFGGAEQLVLDTGTGAVTGTRFLALPGGGQVVRTGAGTAYSFELGDQHGTSLLTLDNTAANPVWRQYTPYGAPRGTAPATWPDTNAFLGKPADTPTGLDLLGARQYDPTTGRFLSPDPVLDPASPQTLNGYSYAAANPVTQSDPTGLHLEACPPSGCSSNSGNHNGTSQCPSGEPGCPGYHGPGGPTAGAGGYNPGPSPGAGCQDWLPGCPGFTGGGAGQGGEQLYGPGAPPPPDLHPVAANYDALARAPVGLSATGVPRGSQPPCGSAVESRLDGCKFHQRAISGNLGTIGLCASGLFFGGLEFGGSVCAVLSENDQSKNMQLGLVFTGGAGTGIPSIGVGVGPMSSNATSVRQLRGPFSEVGGSGQIGVSVGGGAATGLDSQNRHITVASGTVGTGFQIEGVEVGWEIHGIATDTVTWTLFDWHF